MNLTWIHRRGAREKESFVVASPRNGERRKSGMEEITFDFELLGSVTLSPPSLAAFVEVVDAPLPSSSFAAGSVVT